MANRRKPVYSAYEDRYRRFYHKPEDRFTCFYCGDPADCMDHVPPISRVPDYESLGLAHPRYLKVPSCPECNTLAGDELQDSILERWSYIKGALRFKYRRVIRQELWDQEELEASELDGRLLNYVRGHSNHVSRISFRLDYSEGIQAYCDEFDAIDYPERALEQIAV